MEDLKQIAIGIIVTILVVMVIVAESAELWYGSSIPKRFTVRTLLIVATVVAIALGVFVGFSPR
jgi:hypothetical protein